LAVYPEGNPGVYPIDPATPVGQLRFLVGDTASVPYDPVEPGFQNYAAFSDGELLSLLEASGGVLTGAVGFAYLRLAGAAAGSAVSWASDDLRLDMSKTPAELRAIAALWFGRADSSAAGEDALYITDTGIQDHCKDWPELSARPWRHPW